MTQAMGKALWCFPFLFLRPTAEGSKAISKGINAVKPLYEASAKHEFPFLVIILTASGK